MLSKSEKINTGIGFAAFAACGVFVAVLLAPLLDFGVGDADGGFLYRFGRHLVGAYGFSSALIPFFLFAVGCQCFSARWSLRRGVYLGCSLIPFFTVAVTEQFCRSLAGDERDAFFAIKIASALLTSGLLIAIEYVLIGMVADVADDREGLLKSLVRQRFHSLLLRGKTALPPLLKRTTAGACNFLRRRKAALTRGITERFPKFRSLLPWGKSAESPGEKRAPCNSAEPADMQAESVAEEASFARDEMPAADTLAAEMNECGAPPTETGASEEPPVEPLTETAAVESGETIQSAPLRSAAASPAAKPLPAAQKRYQLSPEELLTAYPDGEYWVIDETTRRAADLLRDTLSEFNIKADVTGIRKGPVITMFEILPAPGVKLSKIVALQDNIALRLAASSVRIVAPIPGKHAVGIEVPNRKRSIVSFREIIAHDCEAFRKAAVPVVLGKNIAGEAQIIDLAKTPHMLIAGATGAGKSVCVNSLILSILFTRSPSDVKMILIDPKIVELKLYNDIPHLLTPVITEPKRAFQALQYALCEMERRYALLDGMGVRDIVSYNRRIAERRIAAERLPYIVIIIDEFADLMATTGKELESAVARLAAMSRAVGIHLVLATQRPSIDVITGLIKANIPTRVAFMVASKTDSRIIIDQTGAEKLLGKGDMLYSSATDPFPVRIQGTFVSDSEVESVAEYVKRFGEPDYIDDEIFVDDGDDDADSALFAEGSDPMYDKALDIVIQTGKASASYIQRRLKIGYNRAARLVEEMEARGIVGPANGSKAREIIHVP
ncbi:DNA translocase FtsK [Treponema endosymbiont of Eucomonympha sp.]|uniref:DNA translocase FtsK n=2 Tax=Treponema endosymbiont of Eucomonympha sp. TaxID=1580831 RepID=UPI000AA27D16|nr:DNA translocase FtsK [Treponema endosymbiont of Eucomonympha sp.]